MAYNRQDSTRSQFRNSSSHSSSATMSQHELYSEYETNEFENNNNSELFHYFMNIAILKAKKQVDKYVNLTEDQKDQAIVKLFESTINDVDKINDPFTIEQTMIQLRKDLEYMKSKESNVRPIEIEQREKLYDALDNNR